MNPNLIFELVELVVNLTQTQLHGDDIEDTLLDVIHTAVKAYEDHTGTPLDPEQITAEYPL